MYTDALWEIYKDDGKDESIHAQAYEQKMGALQQAYPDDSEAAVFHALALAITAPKTDKTFSNQRKCGEILESIFTKQPNHPGVAHYIIHCYDNPVLAERGLDAARKYAAIAPLRPMPVTCHRIFSPVWDPGRSPFIPTSGPSSWPRETKQALRTEKLATNVCMRWTT